jgi:hypothetical protein
MAMSRGHDSTPEDARAELAADRLLAALHLQLFCTLTLSVRGRRPLGCGRARKTATTLLNGSTAAGTSPRPADEYSTRVPSSDKHATPHR